MSDCAEVEEREREREREKERERERERERGERESNISRIIRFVFVFKIILLMNVF